MNTRNDWEGTLQMANEDLKQYGMEIIVRPDGPGMEVDDDYHTVFIKDGDEEEVFADNYYERELGEVVNEAWAHARAKAKAKQPQVVWEFNEQAFIEHYCPMEGGNDYLGWIDDICKLLDGEAEPGDAASTGEYAGLTEAELRKELKRLTAIVLHQAVDRYVEQNY